MSSSKRFAKNFDWISKAGVAIALVVALLVAADGILGLGGGSTLESFAIALGIVTVAIIVRMTGMWFMRVTGALD